VHLLTSNLINHSLMLALSGGTGYKKRDVKTDAVNSAIEMEYFPARSPGGEGRGRGQNGTQTPSDHTDNIAVV